MAKRVKDKAEKFKYNTQNYELLSTLSPSKEELTILLRPTKLRCYYQLTLKNQTLSSDLMMLLENVRNVYQCLNDRQLHAVEIEKGEISLRISYQIKQRTIEKETTLKLERIQCEKSEQMDVSSIRMEMEEMKEYLSKQNDKLREELHECKRYIAEMQMKVDNETKNHQILMQQMMVKKEMQSEQFQRSLKQMHDYQEDRFQKQQMHLDKNIERLQMLFLDKLIEQKKQYEDKILQLKQDSQKDVRLLQRQLTEIGNKTEIQQNKLNYLHDKIQTKDKDENEDKQLAYEEYQEKKREREKMRLRNLEEKERLAVLERVQAEEQEELRLRGQKMVQEKIQDLEKKQKEKKAKQARFQEIKKLQKSLQGEKSKQNHKEFDEFDDDREKVQCKQQ